MVKFQEFIIKMLLKPLSRLTAKMSEKTRDTLFVLSGLMIFAQLFFTSSEKYSYRFLIYFCVDCVFLAIMLLCSLKPDIKPVKIKKVMGFCWFATGLLMLASGIVYNMDYLPEAMLFLVVVPTMWILWNNIDFTRIFKLLIKTCIISFVFNFFVCMFFFPIEGEQYKGLFSNVNSTVIYLVPVFVCILVQIVSEKKFNLRTVLNIILLGLCTTMIFYTNSRTGWLAAIVAIATATILLLVTGRAGKHFYRNVILSIASVIIMFNSVVYVFQVTEEVPEIIEEYCQSVFSGYTDDQKEENNKNDEENETSEWIGTSQFLEKNEKKNGLKGKTLDQIFTGRISIWKGTLKELNLFGHSEGVKIEFEYLGQAKRLYHTTHNTFLQVAYENGAIAGVLYFLYAILSFFAAVRFALKNKDNAYALFPLMVITVFLIVSMLESTAISFKYMTTLYYYLVQFPLIAAAAPKKQENNDQAQNEA